MKKKIMIIIPNFKPGGAEKVHVDLANHWYQFYEIVFVVMINKGSLNKYLNKNIKIIETKSNRLREFIIPLSKNIKDINPDIIVSAMWPLTSISLISKFLSFKKPKLYFVEHCKLSGQYLKDINEVISEFPNESHKNISQITEELDRVKDLGDKVLNTPLVECV